MLRQRLIYIPWLVVIIYLGYGASNDEIILPPVRGDSLELVDVQIWLAILAVILVLVAQIIEVENLGIPKFWNKPIYYSLNIIATCLFFYSAVFIGT